MSIDINHIELFSSIHNYNSNQNYVKKYQCLVLNKNLIMKRVEGPVY